MGNDGGSIPKRRELVKSAARAPNMTELKATALESLAHAWTHCSLSAEPLDKRHAVSDWRGRLYDYESVLKNLLEATQGSSWAPTPSFAATGIKTMRDIQELKFTLQKQEGTEMAVCPLSIKVLGPGTKAVYLVPCGHVFAEIALKEVQETTCPECAEEFADENVIPILPTDEADYERLKKRIEKLNEAGLTHTLRKDKSAGKKKKRKAEEAKNGGDEEPVGKRAKADGETNEKSSTDHRVAGINNALAASLTAKVMAEQDENKKRRKMEEAYKKAQISRA